MNFRLAAVSSIALLTLAACTRDTTKASADALAQDSSLARELQLNNRDTTSQPQLHDVATTAPPETPAQAAPTPAPARVQHSPAPRPTTRSPQPAEHVHQRVATAGATEPPPAQSVPRPTPVRGQIPAVMAPTVTPSGNKVRSAPASAGQASGTMGVVSAGTSLALLTGQRVCTNTNTVGDRLTATLADAVTGSNGVVIPAGATAVLEISSLRRSGRSGETMGIGLVVRSIMYEGQRYPVVGQITDAQTEKVKAPGNADAGKVLGGAAVGAILGNVLGGRSRTKGTIIGAAGGAAAGAILANQTATYDACIPSGGRVTVKLDSPISVLTPAR